MTTTTQRTIGDVYRYISNTLFALCFVGIFFMQRGRYPLVSIIITLLAANASWIFGIWGWRTDKRWIFYVLAINPNDPKTSVPSSIVFPGAFGWDGVILMLFTRIASDITGGICLFILMASIFTVSRVSSRLLGMYVCLMDRMNRPDGKESADDPLLYEKLVMTSKNGNNSWAGCSVLVCIVAVFSLVSLFGLTQPGSFIGIPVAVFIIWGLVDLSFAVLSTRFIVNTLIFCFSTNGAGTFGKPEIREMILRQFGSAKTAAMTLPFIYGLLCILVYRAL